MNPALLSLGGIVGGMFVAALNEARKYKNSKPDTDMVVLMGPKESGKSELIAALKNCPFDPNRVGTGARMDPPGIDETFSYGDRKTFCTMESGGEGNLIPNFSDKVAKCIVKRRPRYVLLTLVVDVNKMSEPTVEEDLGQYIHYFKTICEEKPSWLSYNRYMFFYEAYQKGNWGFAIVGTHAKGQSQTVQASLEKLSERLETHAGCFRRIKGVGFLELSAQECRDRVKSLIGGWLDSLHKKSS